MGARLRALDPDKSAAGRTQVAHRGREGGERMQRLPELVQAQGLDVIFEIGGVVAGVASGEAAELGRGRGHRPAPEKCIFPGHAGAPEQAARPLVERQRVPDLVYQAELQMVLQVAPDPRQLVPHLDAVVTKPLSWTNA